MKNNTKTIDEHLLSTEKYVGLAKEAAAKPLARADVDIEYFLDLASKAGQKPVDAKTRAAVWDLFQKTQDERIKHAEAQIKRYKEKKTPEALAQADWYVRELSRIKEFKVEKK